jgi:hypothetical protein
VDGDALRVNRGIGLKVVLNPRYPHAYAETGSGGALAGPEILGTDALLQTRQRFGVELRVVESSDPDAGIKEDLHIREMDRDLFENGLVVERGRAFICIFERFICRTRGRDAVLGCSGRRVMPCGDSPHPSTHRRTRVRRATGDSQSCHCRRGTPATGMNSAPTT